MTGSLARVLFLAVLSHKNDSQNGQWVSTQDPARTKRVFLLMPLHHYEQTVCGGIGAEEFCSGP